MWLAAARGRDEIEREGGKQRGSMPRALPLDLRACASGSHPWTATSGQVRGSSGEMRHGERVHLSACGPGDGWLPGALCGWQGASLRLREKWGAMLAIRSRWGVGSGSRAHFALGLCIRTTRPCGPVPAQAPSVQSSLSGVQVGMSVCSVPSPGRVTCSQVAGPLLGGLPL